MAIQAFGRRTVAQLSPEHYRRHRQQLTEKGTVKKRHADSTKENIWGVMMKWTRHCEFLGEDRLSFLVRATKEDIMTFLKWILDVHPRVRKRSTLDEYWRVWCMLYRKSVGKGLHAKVMEEVRDYIDGYLTIKYNLDTGVREKPVMDVDDVFLVLHHHWVLDTSVFPDERQRLQLAFLLLLSAYTATRPAALVYKATNRTKQREHYLGWEDDGPGDHDEMDLDWEDIKTLCYEDVTLVMLPNPEAKRDLLAMEITLKYTKGYQKKPNPKTYILTEVDTLIFDPILLMITIAILDNAFESNVSSMEDIIRIRVRAPRRSLEFKWRANMLKKPVFRQAERTPTGIQTSPVKALRYHTYLYFLQRLGLQAGLMQILGGYVLRRGAGEAVEGTWYLSKLTDVMLRPYRRRHSTSTSTSHVPSGRWYLPGLH